MNNEKNVYADERGTTAQEKSRLFTALDPVESAVKDLIRYRPAFAIGGGATSL